MYSWRRPKNRIRDRMFEGNHKHFAITLQSSIIPKLNQEMANYRISASGFISCVLEAYLSNQPFGVIIATPNRCRRRSTKYDFIEKPKIMISINENTSIILRIKCAQYNWSPSYLINLLLHMHLYEMTMIDSQKFIPIRKYSYKVKPGGPNVTEKT